MNQRIAYIALVVKDYDEAIAFYTQKLHFTLVEDTIIDEKKRWVVVAPRGAAGGGLLLAKAASEQQSAAVGNQSGGRVFLFLHTDDFERDYRNLEANGIEIVRQPVRDTFGTAAVFKDLYGNLWDLVGPADNGR